jgi:hypothetical protein
MFISPCGGGGGIPGPPFIPLLIFCSFIPNPPFFHLEPL